MESVSRLQKDLLEGLKAQLTRRRTAPLRQRVWKKYSVFASVDSSEPRCYRCPMERLGRSPSLRPGEILEE